MSFKVKNGLSAPVNFIEDVFEIDKMTYSPELCGVKENMYKRYAACKESFILVYDDDKLAAYINFFPVSDAVNKAMTDRNNPHMYDDDITAEDIKDWRLDNPIHVFVVSVMVCPEYRKDEAIVLLSNALLDFFRDKKEAGYSIGSISGYAVSGGGVKFLKRMECSLLKSTDEGYHYFFADEAAANDFIEDGFTLNKYEKTYENDIYFFIPMTSEDIDGNFKKMMEADKCVHSIDEDFDYAPTEDMSDLEFGDLYCKLVNRHIEYECKNPIFKGENMKRFYLGEFELACYDDDYDEIPLDIEDAHIFITAHKNTGLYIVTLAIPNNQYCPTQLIDQMSADHLDIRPKKNDGENTEKFVQIETYMQNRFDITVCGDTKCVVCMSDYPKDRNEVAYMLAGETMYSKHIDYHVRSERLEKFMVNRACYDYYDSYISNCVIAYIFDEYSHDLKERIEAEASELFIVEIVLFQNTAVLRTNRKVIKALETENDLTNEEIDDMYIEFGKTMEFWGTDVFKYPIAQLEAEEVINSFGISNILDEYHRNQQFLDRLIELKSNIEERKSDDMMNFILYILSCIEGSTITLGAVLWITGMIFSIAKGENINSFISPENGVRVLWIVFFIVACIVLHRIISSKFMIKSSRKKRKKHKKQR